MPKPHAQSPGQSTYKLRVEMSPNATIKGFVSSDFCIGRDFHKSFPSPSMRNVNGVQLPLAWTISIHAGNSHSAAQVTVSLGNPKGNQRANYCCQQGVLECPCEGVVLRIRCVITASGGPPTILVTGFKSAKYNFSGSFDACALLSFGKGFDSTTVVGCALAISCSSRPLLAMTTKIITTTRLPTPPNAQGIHDGTDFLRFLYAGAEPILGIASVSTRIGVSVEESTGGVGRILNKIPSPLSYAAFCCGFSKQSRAAAISLSSFWDKATCGPVAQPWR